jgi:hypothetical protein
MASNFFSKASLVMVPDAPIDGKLPSVKPEDRSGDFTFSRGSNLAATRITKDSLIEKGRENLLLQSNQFDATWTTFRASMSSGIEGYDGTNDAWLLETTGTSGRVRQSLNYSGNIATFSVYAKAAANNWVRLRTDGPTSYTSFNLDPAATGSRIGASSSSLLANIEDVGNGWFKCSITVVWVDQEVSIWKQDDGDGNAGGSGSIYIQDAQLEVGLVATDYIESGATTGKAGLLENEPRIDFTGGGCGSLLLEPSRTNLVAQSEWFGEWDSFSTFLTHKDGISPSGYKDATKLYIPADNANVYIRTQFSNVANQTHIGSIFLKKVDGDEVRLRLSGGAPNIEASAIFNLSNGTYRDAIGSVTPSIENYGNGWYRCSVGDLGGATVATPSLRIDALGTGYAPTVYVWGAQVEVGSYPTSYIPAYGSSVTRSDDFMNISSLADEIDGNSFTYFLEVNNEAVVRDASTGNISIGASGNRLFLYNDSSAERRMKLFIQDGTTQNYVLSADNVKLVVRIEPNKVEVFENGVSVLSTTQNLDFSNNSAYVLRGTTREIGIKQTAIFPTALTDDECIALTTI